MSRASFILALVAVAASVAADVTVAEAQILDRPGVVWRVSDVAQFGVPRDTRFVFCDGEDCPARSIKHLNVPDPPLPTPVPVPLAEPRAIPSPAGLPRAEPKPVMPEPGMP